MSTYVCVHVKACACESVVTEKQGMGTRGPTLPTPCLGPHSPGSFPSTLMKHFFMSYSHPVLTTTIVSLQGPHVSHHQWDPNVADKIISLFWGCNHIPPAFQILFCLPLRGVLDTQTTISFCSRTSPTSPLPPHNSL